MKRFAKNSNDSLIQPTLQPKHQPQGIMLLRVIGFILVGNPNL